MELSKIPTLVVGLIVAILIVTVVAIPIIDDASKSIYSEFNNPEGLYSISNTADGPVTITTDGTSLYINDIAQTKAISYGSCKMWGLDFCVYVNTDSGSMALSGTYNGTTYNVTKSVKYESGVITVTTGLGNELTFESPFFIYPDDNGDYVEYTVGSSPNVHINNDATIYFGYCGPTYALVKADKNGVEQIGSVIGQTGFDKVTVNFNKIASEDGMSYQLASIPTMTFTNSGTSESSDKNWIVMYAPLKYNAVSEMDGAIKSIIDIIPVILIVSMLIAIVATVFVKNQ